MSDAFEEVKAFYYGLAESDQQAALDRMSRAAFELGLYDRNEIPKSGGDE
jgi:hypothetical protein